MNSLLRCAAPRRGFASSALVRCALFAVSPRCVGPAYARAAAPCAAAPLLLPAVPARSKSTHRGAAKRRPPELFKKMSVIVTGAAAARQDEAARVPELGEYGEVVKVRKGFARNFLLPRNLCVSDTPENREQHGTNTLVIDVEERARRRMMKQARRRISKIVVVVKRQQLGKSGAMHAPVSKQQVLEKLQRQHGLELRSEDVFLTMPITSYGAHSVPVVLDTFRASLTVNVVRR